MYAAYFDRQTENDEAVLLVEQLKKDFHIPLTSLPSGSEPGQWFHIQIEDGQVIKIQTDEEKTTEMETDIQSRLNRLKSKRTSRFKRR